MGKQLELTPEYLKSQGFQIFYKASEGFNKPYYQISKVDFQLFCNTQHVHESANMERIKELEAELTSYRSLLDDAVKEIEGLENKIKTMVSLDILNEVLLKSKEKINELESKAGALLNSMSPAEKDKHFTECYELIKILNPDKK